MRRTVKNVATLVMVSLLVLIAACAPAPKGITPPPTPTPEEVIPPPIPEPTPPPEEVTPPPTSEPAPTPEPEFFLTVTQPADNSIINTDKVEVMGCTSSRAVVSVNGELAEVDEEGNFTMMVVLEEGPNIIEVIASDLEGNQESCVLVIIYVP